jgi:hypothetical protein
MKAKRIGTGSGGGYDVEEVGEYAQCWGVITLMYRLGQKLDKEMGLTLSHRDREDREARRRGSRRECAQWWVQ